MSEIWTSEKPTEPGAYWVKDFELYGRALSARRGKALVEVRRVDGDLRCNLHEQNSDNDTDQWSAIAVMDDAFRWCGPLVPPNKHSAP